MKTLLVAVDFSPVMDEVLAAAVNLAKAMAAKVYLIHVAAPEPSFVTYEPGPQHERKFQADTLRKEHRDLQAMADKLRGEGCEAEALMVQGPTSAKIIEESQRLDAAMIVMGSHGHGALYDLLVGSVTDGVLRKSERPVVVVPGKK